MLIIEQKTSVNSSGSKQVFMMIKLLDQKPNLPASYFFVYFDQFFESEITAHKILQGIQWFTSDPKIISILYHSNLGSTLLPDHPYLRICSAYRWFSWFVHDLESRKEMWYRFRVKLSEIIFSNPKNRISKAV